MEFKIPKDVLFIIDTFHKKGFDAHIVGGCVRDCILNREPNDWDITTDAIPDTVVELFDHTVPTGIKHGTVTVIINRNNYEVTTYRIDGKYSDNRHPDSVIFTKNLKDDLSRRDFTINSIAYNYITGIVDPFEGLSDIKSKLIRCVGHPDERFNEDALRMIRAVRFACQLNFSIHIDTFNSIKKNCSLIKNVSIERIREELIKILMSDIPSLGIYNLLNSGLLQYIFPEIMPCVSFDQKNKYHNKNVFDHIMSVVDNSPKNLIVRLSALLHDIGKPFCFSIDKKGICHFYEHQNKSAEITESILKRFKFDNNTIKTVTILIKEHMFKYKSLKASTIKKFITRVGIENLNNFFQLQEADIKGSAYPCDFSALEYLKKEVNHILNTKQPLSSKDLDINGEDIIKLGFKPGKIIGDILNYLLDKVLENPELNKKDILLSLIHTYDNKLNN